MGDWTLEATVELTVGKGLPAQLQFTAPIDAHAAALTRRGAEGEAAEGDWQKLRGAWLQITGATNRQRQALLEQLDITAPAH